jgi:hypothetical protein
VVPEDLKLKGVADARLYVKGSFHTEAVQGMYRFNSPYFGKLSEQYDGHLAILSSDLVGLPCLEERQYIIGDRQFTQDEFQTKFVESWNAMAQGGPGELTGSVKCIAMLFLSRMFCLEATQVEPFMEFLRIELAKEVKTNVNLNGPREVKGILFQRHFVQNLAMILLPICYDRPLLRHLQVQRKDAVENVQSSICDAICKTFRKVCPRVYKHPDSEAVARNIKNLVQAHEVAKEHAVAFTRNALLKTRLLTDELDDYKNDLEEKQSEILDLHTLLETLGSYVPSILVDRKEIEYHTPRALVSSQMEGDDLDSLSDASFDASVDMEQEDTKPADVTQTMFSIRNVNTLSGKATDEQDKDDMFSDAGSTTSSKKSTTSSNKRARKTGLANPTVAAAAAVSTKKALFPFPALTTSSARHNNMAARNVDPSQIPIDGLANLAGAATHTPIDLAGAATNTPFGDGAAANNA